MGKEGLRKEEGMELGELRKEGGRGRCYVMKWRKGRKGKEELRKKEVREGGIRKQEGREKERKGEEDML